MPETIWFTGSIKSNGFKKKTTKYWARYCKYEYHRAEVHEALTKRIATVYYTGEQRADFIKAFETV